MILQNCGKLPELLVKGQKEIYCKGIFFSARSVLASEISTKGRFLVIMPSADEAEYFTNDLYGLCDGDDVFYLPSRKESAQKSNYKSTISVQRTSALHFLEDSSKERIIIVAFPESIEDSVPSHKALAEPVISFKVGEDVKFSSLPEILSTNGFEKVDFVSSPGEFSLRGGIIDVFSFGNSEPYRITFFGDEVDSITVFDYNSQLSKEKIKEASIYPDYSSTDETEEENLISILPKDTVIFLDSSELYQDHPFMAQLDGFQKIYFQTPVDRKEADVEFHIAPQPSFNKNFDLLSRDISLKAEQGYKVHILGDKQTQIDRLRNILLQDGIIMADFITGKSFHQGFIDNDSKECWYTDHEIFDRFHRAVMRRTIAKSEQLTLNDLNSFNIGDYIVHIDYGVGMFGGLVKKNDEYGRPQEAIKIIYKDNDIIFLSVHALNKISRFKGKDDTPPTIHRLGSKIWQNLKESTKKKVKDIAKDLINLYAVRRNTKGYAFSADSYLMNELESSFMYEDTPDQMSAIEAVKRDMEDDCPMDRLICGDVGFGKTEVAIRASFKAVCDSKQVAVLVPTTILALQHYNTFCGRLKGFPVNIEYVSRLKKAKEITDIKKRLQSGQIDIIIGTHKLLSKDFEFKDLGLLVIDEEQKFGVSAKEKLRQMKANVDTLTLSATPIPRTLQFSLLGARDLSIIATPPANRIPVQTEIMTFDPDEVKRIINYELNRGGQVFFLHNKVHELESIRRILNNLIPEMRICVTHGQMDPKELEDKILSFIAGDYDLLLCTTIIENGLDIPNANTIIINQAQNIGLSDLHQLRGRVGRSNKRAFCYLIVPPLTSVSDDARRRLQAIEAFSDLGSGFNIAMQDLDIRGAGNLLGAEQSGFITEMGFETYQKVLAEALDELGIEGNDKGGGQREKFVVDTTVELDVPALIPDSYMDITEEKIRIYKELDSIRDTRVLDRFTSHLEDRFGKMPPEVERLIWVVRIRNLGEKLGFEKIIVKNNILIAFFISNPLSSYYKSDVYEKVMIRICEESKVNFELKQMNGKLRIIVRGVPDIVAAYGILEKLL